MARRNCHFAKRRLPCCAGLAPRQRAFQALYPTIPHLFCKMLDHGFGIVRGAKSATAHVQISCVYVPDTFHSAMRPYELILVRLSTDILCAAAAESPERKGNTLAVRLALRCLMPYCRQRWPLVAYWEAAGDDHPIGRSQNMMASYHAIVRQLRRSGAWRD